jgi:hypothetical protein
MAIVTETAKRILVGATFFTLVALGRVDAQGNVRKWTNSKGLSIEASLEKIGDGNAYLRKQNRTFVYPLESLSEADRAYCKKAEEFGPFWQKLNQGRWFIFTLDNAFPITLEEDKLQLASMGGHQWSKSGKLITVKSVSEPARTFEFSETISGFRGVMVESSEPAELYQASGSTKLEASVIYARPPYYRLRITKCSGWIAKINENAKAIDLRSEMKFVEGDKLEIEVGEPLSGFSPFGAIIVPHLRPKDAKASSSPE